MTNSNIDLYSDINDPIIDINLDLELDIDGLDDIYMYTATNTTMDTSIGMTMSMDMYTATNTTIDATINTTMNTTIDTNTVYSNQYQYNQCQYSQYSQYNQYSNLDSFINYAKYIINLHQSEIERTLIKVRKIDKTITEKTTKLQICKLRLDILKHMPHLDKYVEYVMATKFGVDYVYYNINNDTNISNFIPEYQISYYKNEVKRLFDKYNLLSDKIIRFDKNRKNMINKSIRYIERKERKKDNICENKKRKLDDL